MASVRVDLRTLSLKPGRYKIQAKASGIGHRSSEFSNIVEYKVGYEIIVNYSTGTYKGSTFMSENGEGEIKLIAAEGYDLPDARALSVTGADFTYNAGTIYLFNPISDITINADGFEADSVVSYDLKRLVSQDNKKLKYAKEKD